MEPRAALGVYDAASGRYTLHAGSGGVVRQKGRELAAMLGVEDGAVRVIARDTGGNFGTKNSFFPEFVLVAWASRRLARPVKWTCERGEAFLSDYQGRDLTVEAELALDAEGNFMALRSRTSATPARTRPRTLPLSKGASIITSVYRFPGGLRARPCRAQQHAADHALPQRRPARAIFVVERLIDLAARELASTGSSFAGNLRSRSGHAVPQPLRPRLRQRRVRPGDVRGALAG